MTARSLGIVTTMAPAQVFVGFSSSEPQNYTAVEQAHSWVFVLI
tara:strand:- start:227 stop:358 length:132 start_codon:yes stop_codon:yes gene_type:complete